MPQLQILKERLTGEMSAGIVCLLLTPLGSAFGHQGHLEVPPPPRFSFVAEGHQFPGGPVLVCNQKTSLSH